MNTLDTEPIWLPPRELTDDEIVLRLRALYPMPAGAYEVLSGGRVMVVELLKQRVRQACPDREALNRLRPDQVAMMAQESCVPAISAVERYHVAPPGLHCEPDWPSSATFTIRSGRGGSVLKSGLKLAEVNALYARELVGRGAGQ